MSYVDSKYVDLKKEIFKSYTAKILKVLGGFLSIVILARYLGVSSLGQYFIALTLIEILNQVCSGFAATVQKRCSESQSNSNEILSISLTMYLVYTLLLFLPLYLFHERLFNIVSINSNLLFPIYFSVVFVGSFRIITKYVSGLGFPGRANFLNAGKNFASFLLHVVFILMSFGVYHMVLAEALSAFALAVIAIIDKPAIPSFSKKSLKEVVTFSKWSIPNSLLFIITHRMDVLVLSVFVGPTSVGIYQSAYKLLQPAIMLSNAFSQPLIVKISNLNSKNIDFKEHANKILAYSGILPIPLLIGALLLRDRIMTLLFGSDFVGTGLILVIVALYVTISVYRKQFIAISYGMDYPSVVFKAQFLFFIINVPLSIYAAIKFGVIGVIIVTVISEVITLLLYLYVHRDIVSSYPIGEIKNQLYSSIIMFALLSPVVFFTEGMTILINIPILAIGGIIYSVSLLLLSSEIRKFMKENWKEIREKISL